MLPTNAKDRKDTPIFSGVIKYFPDALAEIARVSKAGNDQHNPGQPLHWDRSKSTDHLDCAQRHLIEAGTVDTDGQRHTAKLAWRALAQLQTELEAERELVSALAQVQTTLEAERAAPAQVRDLLCRCHDCQRLRGEI